MNRYLLIIAVVIDIIIGDPQLYPHPVVMMGKVINLLEIRLRKVVKRKVTEKMAGLFLVIIMIILTFSLTFYILKLANYLNNYLGFIITVFLLSTTIAIKGLVKAGKKIYQALKEENITLARRELAKVVGRDTKNLKKSEIIRGTIETLAENTSDGIIAPIFYAALGGVPLAMAYKAINTMDSMLGYKNKRYRYFGWAAARVDDFANWIPARITAVLFVLVALILGKDWKRAIKVIRRDARKHPSPNAGYPEAAVAGILGLRLGGVNYYQGEKSFRAYLGQKINKFDLEQIKVIISLIYFTLFLFLSFSYVI